MKIIAFKHVRQGKRSQMIPIAPSMASIAGNGVARGNHRRERREGRGGRRLALPLWPADLIGDPAVAVCEGCRLFGVTHKGKPHCQRFGGCNNAVRYVQAVRKRACPIELHAGIPPKGTER